jgi:hypothetical protein
VVEGVERAGRGGVDRLAAAELAPPPDEGDHRADLQHQHQQEERHLDPEEGRVQVELGALLEPAERAQEAGDDPEQRRDAPRAVGREQPPEPVRVERPLERAAAQEHRGEADGEGQQVQGRHYGREHA